MEILMAKFSVDINTYFTVEGISKEQVEQFVLDNIILADLDGDILEWERNDYGIEIAEIEEND
jgi:hypothetical protein